MNILFRILLAVALLIKSLLHTGLLLDCGMEPVLRARHVQAANAARATLGVDVAAVVLTPRPVG